MKEAIKLAKDAGLNIEYDKLSPDGSYMVTTKNGEILRSPLTALFNKTIGQNPQFAEMFKTKAYVDRNDWAHSKVNLGEYGDINEAQLGYIKQIDKQNQAKIEEQADALNIDISYLDQKSAELEEDYKNGRFQEGSQKYNQLLELKDLQSSAKNAKAYTDQIASVSVTNQAGINTLTDHIDNQNSYTLFNDEIQGAVNTLIFKDAKSTMKIDDFAKMKVEHGYKISEMAAQHKFDTAEEAQASANKIALEDHKKSIGHSSYTGDSGKDLLNKSDAYIDKKNAAESFNLETKARENMKKLGFGTEVPTTEDVAEWKKAAETNDDSNDGEIAQGKWKNYQKAKAAAEKEFSTAQREANKAAVAYGEIPKFRDVMTATDIAEYNKKYDWDYQESWLTNTFNDVNKKYKKEYGKDLTQERFQHAIQKADGSKPLVEEIKNNLKLD